MVRVPAPKGVSATEVRPSRTEQRKVRSIDPGVFSGQDAGAVALQHLGQAFTGASEDLAQVGILNLKREQARQAEDGITQYKQRVFDLTYGPDGYRTKKGQNALDAAPKYQEDIEAIRREIGNNIKDPRARELYEPQSQTEKQVVQTRIAEYTLQEQNTAQNASDKARIQILQNEWLSEPNPNSELADANNQLRKNEMVQMLQEIMDRGGITDPDLRVWRVRSELSQLHGSTIERLLNEGRAKEAEIYFKRASAGGEILSNARGELVKAIEAGSALEQAYAAVDQVLANPAYTTAGQRREAVTALTKHDDKIREEAEKQMRLHNAAVERERSAGDRTTREEIIQHFTNGGDFGGLTVQQREVMARTLGMGADMEKLQTRIANGTRETSDLEAKAEVYRLRGEEPEKFLNLDFTLPKYRSKLSSADIEQFELMKVSLLDKADTRLQAKIKDLEKSTHLNAGLAAARDLIESFKLSTKKEAIFNDAFVAEIARRVDAGDVLTPVEYRKIARSLYSFQAQDISRETLEEREERGIVARGLLIDPSMFAPTIRLMERIGQAKGVEGFTSRSREAFISENKKEIEQIQNEINQTLNPPITFEDTATAIEAITRIPGAPTPFVVKRLIERQRRLRQKPTGE